MMFSLDSIYELIFYFLAILLAYLGLIVYLCSINSH